MLTLYQKNKMKNFKLFFTAFLIFATGKNLFAESNLFNIALSTDFGLMNGIVKEYVFDSECHNTDDILSRLDWDVKNIPVFNFSLTANLFKYGFFTAQGFFAVPKSSGKMEDRDWLNCIDFNKPQKYGTELTNYSYHENFLTDYYGFSAKLGAAFFIPLIIIDLRIKPFLAYQYEFIAFDGKNGYRKYKSENWEKISFNGKVISYFQEINSFLIGIDFYVSFLDFFNIQCDFSISPYTTNINALDFHYLTKTAYLDKINKTLQLETNLKMNLVLKKHNNFFVQGFLQYIPIQKGLDYVKSIDKNGKYTSSKWILANGAEGGTSRFLFKISLGYSFIF